MKRIALVAIFVTSILLLAFSTPIVAQVDSPRCDPAAVVKKAASLSSVGEKQADLNALNQLRDEINAVNVACTGLRFSGTGSKVLDPFDLPGGNYRLQMTWQGSGRITVSLSSVDDRICSAFLTVDSPEQLVKTDGCRAVLEVVDRDQKPWTIVFESLDEPPQIASVATSTLAPVPTSAVPLYVSSPSPSIPISYATPTTAATLSKAEVAVVTRTAQAQRVAWTRTAIMDSRMATNDVKTATAMFIAEYKPIDRRELTSYPNRHIGEKVIIQGRVFNIIGEYAFQMFLANSYDAVVVRTRDPLEGIYENTFLKVYGEVAGTWIGTNAYGAEIEQPLIEEAVVVKQ